MDTAIETITIKCTEYFFKIFCKSFVLYFEKRESRCIFVLTKETNKIIHIQKLNTMTNYEFTKSVVFNNRLFAGVNTWNEARKICLKGCKAITRKERKQLFQEYKDQESLDTHRLMLGACVNLETNLAVTEDNKEYYSNRMKKDLA